MSATPERSDWDRPQTAPVPRFEHGSRVPGWDDAVDLTKDPAVVPDPATTPVPDDLRQEIEAAMARYPDPHSASIPALHAAQLEHGWCSPEAIDQVAAVMGVTPAYLTSVATFYDMLVTYPKGHNDVFVCTNISCSLRGADELYEAMSAAAEEEEDITVRSFECLVGPLEHADIERIFADLRAGKPVLEEKQLRFRPCADPGAAGE